MPALSVRHVITALLTFTCVFLLVPANTAFATTPPWDCDGATCQGTIEIPGGGGGGNTGGGGDAPSTDEGTTDFTPEPKDCKLSWLSSKGIACTTPEGGAWSNDDQCHWQLDDTPSDPPPRAADTGACYTPQHSTPPWLATA